MLSSAGSGPVVGTAVGTAANAARKPNGAQRLPHDLSTKTPR